MLEVWIEKEVSKLSNQNKSNQTINLSGIMSQFLSRLFLIKSSYISTIILNQIAKSSNICDQKLSIIFYKIAFANPGVNELI